MRKSKLQLVRESKELTIEELAKKAAVYSHLSGSYGNILLSIRYIEQGERQCPKPRKTYEYQALANILECKVSDIFET